MAIGYARVEFVKRSEGKTACAKAAYNSRSEIKFEGNNTLDPEVYDWSGKEKPAFHDILLPEGVNEKFKKMAVLWNAVEAKEKKCNSQVAIDLVLALPDDKEITVENRIELVRGFVNEQFISKGLAAQIDVHKPEKRVEVTRDNKDLGLIKGMRGHLIQEKGNSILHLETGEKVSFDPKEFTGFIEKEHNWHAHVLITTRRFTEDGLELGEKARDLMPRIMKGKVVAGPDWGKLWTEHQNQFFEKQGLALRVDREGVIPQKHLGPVRMRGRAFALFDEHSRRLEANALESSDPANILKKITESKSVFTREEVDAFLQKHVPSAVLAGVREAFWKQEGIVQLVDKSTMKPLEKFSSEQVVEEERAILRMTDRMHAKTALKIDMNRVGEYAKNLSGEQTQAYFRILTGERLSCIHGCAGTGKSHLLTALYKAYQEAGYRVRAFGPDGATVDVLKSKGFENAENVYRFLFALRHDKRQIANGKEIWIFDETSKLGNRPFLEFVREAEKRNVPIIFAGDFRQLPPVERGGMFKMLCERYSSVALEEVQRQRSGKQREIAKNLATGEFGAAIDKLCSSQGIRWSPTKKGAIEALIEKWALDTQSSPQSSTLIIPYTNDEVRVLNEMVRIIRKQRGELQGKEFDCETAMGKIYVSVGDRIEFRRSDKELGVTNGLAGTLIEAQENRFVVSIKGDGKRTHIVTFNPQEYHAYQLGYASTYYRAQGRTVQKAYVLHSPYMNRETFYVGLTRHIEEVYCFVSKEEVKCLSDLKRQATKEGFKETTLDFSTVKEIQDQLQSEKRAKEVQALKASDSFLDRVTGYGRSVWDLSLARLNNVQERVQDRFPNKQFYHPDISGSTEVKASVVEIRAEPMFVETKEKIYSGEQQPANASSKTTPILSSENQRQETKMTGSFLEKCVKSQNALWEKLGAEKQSAIREYFDSWERASTLGAVVEAETLANEVGSPASHFQEWQLACGKRNTAAHTITQKISAEELKTLLGEKVTKIALDQASRHLSIVERGGEHKKIDLEEHLKENIEPLLYRLFPEGSTGRDKKGLRFGNKGSLSVVCTGSKAGTFFDFEKQEGGGLLQLIQRETGSGRQEAQKWAREFLGVAQEIKVPKAFLKTPRQEKDGDWVSLKPDANVPAPKLEELSGKKLQHYYTEQTRHAYRDENGQLLYYVLRLRDKQDPQRKITPPLSYGYWKSNPEKPHWELKGFQTDKHSLYNLHLLRQNPTATVIVVEGEKTADAAVGRFPGKNLVSITWSGGSGAVSRAAWEPLAGRNVIVWPDNDKAGRQAAEQVCLELRKVGIKSLEMVDPELLKKHFPEKWDLADPLPEGVNERLLNGLVSSGLKKGINPEEVFHRVSSLNNESPLEKARINEVLYRVDARLRPALEQQHGMQFRKIHEEILKETSRILLRKDEWLGCLRGAFGAEGVLLDRLSYLALIYEAKYAKEPTEAQLHEMKDLIGKLGFVSSSKDLDKQTVHFSLDRALAQTFERHPMGALPAKGQLEVDVRATAHSLSNQIAGQRSIDSMQQKDLGKGRGLEV